MNKVYELVRQVADDKLAPATPLNQFGSTLATWWPCCLWKAIGRIPISVRGLIAIIAVRIAKTRSRLLVDTTSVGLLKLFDN